MTSRRALAQTHAQDRAGRPTATVPQQVSPLDLRRRRDKGQRYGHRGARARRGRPGGRRPRPGPQSRYLRPELDHVGLHLRVGLVQLLDLLVQLLDLLVVLDACKTTEAVRRAPASLRGILVYAWDSVCRGKTPLSLKKGSRLCALPSPTASPLTTRRVGWGARALALAGRAPRRPAQPGCGCARCGPGPAAASPSALALSLSRAHVPGNTAGSLPSLSSGFGWEGDEQL